MRNSLLPTVHPRPALPGGTNTLLALAFVLGASIFSLNAQQMLFDFGSAGSPTQPGTGGSVTHWNNVTTVGTDPAGLLFDLVDTEGTVTDLWLQMLARFNGANESGSTTAPDYPPSASRDSLYGNTESFNEMVDIFPEFRLSGLTTGATYDLTFYGSRLGVGDNRETRYTLTGATEAVLDLNVAENVEQSVSVEGMEADAVGEIMIGLTPGPNNDNGNHFTYLGALQLDWEQAPPAGPATLVDPMYAEGRFQFRLSGSAGATYTIQGSSTLDAWTDLRTVTLSTESEVVEIDAPASWQFYRAANSP